MIFVDYDDDDVEHKDILMRILMTVVEMMMMRVIFQEVFYRLSQIAGLEQELLEVMMMMITPDICHFLYATAFFCL